MLSSGKKRIRYILIGILSLLILAAVVFQVYIDRYLEPVIRRRLERLIVAGSDSLYNFQLGKVDVNFWGGSVRLEKFQVHVDSTRYAEQEKSKTLPALTFSVNLDKGAVTGINLLALLFRNKINVQSIISKNADLTLSRHFKKSDQEISSGGEPLWKLLQPDIESINIGRIMLEDLNLHYSNADSATAFKLKFDHVSALLDNTSIDSLTAADSTRILFTKNIFLQLKDTRLHTSDALYALDMKKLEYSSLTKEVTIDSVHFRPLEGRDAFYKQAGLDKDRFNLSFPKIKMINFYLPQWINNNELVIDTVNLDNPQINIYKDRTVKPDMRYKYGNYPHQLLAKAPFMLRIKKVFVSDAGVTYTERNRQSFREGKLVFQNLDGTIKNMTNDKADIQRNSNCIADIKGTFAQHSPIHAVFAFHLNDAAAGGFEVNADIKNLTAAQLNPIAIPLTQTSIKSFTMQEMHYYMKGNERFGTGNLRMIYDDLQMEFREKDEDDGELKKKKLFSFIVNRFVVHRKNDPGEKERKAIAITTRRIPYKSFFNLVWKNLYGCARDIAIRIDGLKEDKKRKNKK